MKNLRLILVLIIGIIITIGANGEDVLNLIKKGDLAALKARVNSNSGIINHKDQNGKTLLHVAAEEGKNDIILFLLDRGLKVGVENINKTTPLHFAAFKNRPEAVKILVAKGADVNKPNGQFLNSLYFAIIGGHQEIVKILLKNGANVNSLDREKGMPLHTAAQRNKLEICKILLKHRANPTHKDNNHRAPLFFAALSGNVEIIELLISKGAKYNGTDKFGKSCLYAAMSRRKEDAAKWFINKGIKLSGFKTLDGNSYLHAAVQADNLKLVKILISKGIKDDNENAYGQTPYMIALKKKNQEVLKVFKSNGLTRVQSKTKRQRIYPGGKSPGLKPVIFAPGLITNQDSNDRDICFSSDLKSMYYTQNWKIKEIKKTKTGWSEPQNVFSGRAPEAEAFLTPDNKKLFFISRRSAVKGTPPTAWEIWFSSKTDQGWSTPKLLGEPFKGCFYTTFTDDYVMYYTGLGNDIYKSRFKDNKFLKPEKLGSGVNTDSKAGEYNSFIAPDESYLIFTSLGKKDQLGGGDLYISFKKSDGNFSEAINMGKEINSPAHEYCPSVSPDGKYFFFSSTKLGNRDDIYWMDSKIIENIKKKYFK